VVILLYPLPLLRDIKEQSLEILKFLPTLHACKKKDKII
jgi:hypothetical protein